MEQISLWLLCLQGRYEGWYGFYIVNPYQPSRAIRDSYDVTFIVVLSCPVSAIKLYSFLKSMYISIIFLIVFFCINKSNYRQNLGWYGKWHVIIYNYNTCIGLILVKVVSSIDIYMCNTFHYSRFVNDKSIFWFAIELMNAPPITTYVIQSAYV